MFSAGEMRHFVRPGRAGADREAQERRNPRMNARPAAHRICRRSCAAPLWPRAPAPGLTVPEPGEAPAIRHSMGLFSGAPRSTYCSTHARTHTHTRTYTRTHTHKHTHTHTHIWADFPLPLGASIGNGGHGPCNSGRQQQWSIEGTVPAEFTSRNQKKV